MAIFKLKEHLPHGDQVELERILEIPADIRTASEAAFIASRESYIYNEVILCDSQGRIVIAAGNDIPEGVKGFKKGAVFIHKIAPSDDGRYYNAGNEENAIWGATGSPSPSASVSPSASESASESSSESSSPSASDSPSSSESPSASASESPSSSLSPSSGASPSSSASPSVSISPSI